MGTPRHRRTGSEPEKVKVQIYITPAQHRALKIIAAQESESMSDLIAHWINAAADVSPSGAPDSEE
jgi:hypothetical protein